MKFVKTAALIGMFSAGVAEAEHVGKFETLLESQQTPYEV